MSFLHRLPAPHRPACLPLLFVLLAAVAPSHAAEASLAGEPRCWHKLTLSIPGPKAAETDTAPNPFLDYRLTVTFAHPGSGESYAVPGYFAADGNAGETGATSGDIWRAHFSASRPGEWTYRVAFVAGEQAALQAGADGKPVAGVDGLAGSFSIQPTNKTGRDFRARGRLQHVGARYLRFAETGERFFKAGPDAPETLLAYKDFDGTRTRKAPLKSWQPHVRDWREGDPTWRGGKGKGLVGAVNYLASKGVNSMSFIPYNAGGDGDNVWPMIAPDKKRHYDCSKLDQWQVVFDHAQQSGVFLHFKLQETENDDRFTGRKPNQNVPDALDGGELGVQRKLYLREMVARFGHELALNWNLGEENTQTPQQQKAMAAYLRAIDPYNHHVVLHSYPQQQEKVYRPHVGDKASLTGASLQNDWKHAHRQTRLWVAASADSGHPWAVANDEQGPANLGVPCDPAFAEHPGRKANTECPYTLDDIRKQTLWGTLMAGGYGVEYYFGYALAENDLLCEDWRSRDAAWDDCRVALDFFRGSKLPLEAMRSADELIRVTGGAPANDKQPRGYCLAKPGAAYLVYLLSGGNVELDLSGTEGGYRVAWFNPREGGATQAAEVAKVDGGGRVSLGAAPSEDDWVIVVEPN